MKDILRAFRLILLGVLVTACGSSGSGGTHSSTGASAPAANLAAYDRDGGGVTGASDVAQQAGYTSRYSDADVFDHFSAGYALVEQGLATAQDQNQVETGDPGAIGSETAILWQPNGRRDTALPPSPHGERIYAVVVLLDGYIQGGDATAQIAFVSRVQGDALNPKDPSATPAGVAPDQIYTYKLDKATAAALLNAFFVKGAPPATDSPEESPTDG